MFAVVYELLAKALDEAFTMAAVLVALPVLAVPGGMDYLG